MYLVVHNDSKKPQCKGYEPFGQIISHHRNLSDALNAFRKRNPCLFNRADGSRIVNVRTFDEIVEVDKAGHVVEPESSGFCYYN